jgi:hypothetical protein
VIAALSKGAEQCGWRYVPDGYLARELCAKMALCSDLLDIYATGAPVPSTTPN